MARFKLPNSHPLVFASGVSFDLDEKYIEAAEAKLGCRLPDNYRAALIANYGGCVWASNDLWHLHPILDSSNNKRLSRTSTDIIHETEEMRNWRGWPENGIAIGANGAGDVLLFLRQGTICELIVYVWAHETGELIKAACDFSELKRGD